MLPTLSKSGDVVVLEHMPFQWNKYKAGDIVVATSPHDPTKSICKRVLGLEGDTVSYTSGFISSKVKVSAGSGGLVLFPFSEFTLFSIQCTQFDSGSGGPCLAAGGQR